MANSAFQKKVVATPVTPSNGGTGLTSLTDKGVLVGAGTGNVTTVAPGTSGNVLKSDGTNWTSGVNSGVADGSVTYNKVASDLINIVAMSTNNVDWSAGSIFTKTLTTNTTLTFSNYQLDKMIVLKISGNFTLSLPAIVNLISGTYNGTVINYITLHCTNATGGSEEVWAMINQGTASSIENYYGYGYFAGGDSGTYVVTADRIVFSTGVTLANTVSNLSQSRHGLTGISDISLYGYFAGGFNGGYLTITDRIVFSTGVTSANTISNLSQGRYGSGGASDGSLYGYVAGGNSGSVVVTTDRIVFSTGATSANTVSNISQARYGLAGVSDSSLYGYFAGGTTGATPYTTTADRITFSTGATSANTVSNISQARYSLAGLSDNSLYGYFAGGTTGAVVATAERIVFSTGATSANTVSNLSQARRYLAGISDSSTYGYFAGGHNGSLYLKTADRVEFSSGATSANTVSNISQARYVLGGLSDCGV